MNKRFSTALSNYGMTINGNFAYGIIHGYETNATVNLLDNFTPLRMHISFYATPEQHQNIEAAINNLKIKYFKMEFTTYGISLGFNEFTAGQLIKKLPGVLDSIYGVLSDNGALKSEFCPVCGGQLGEGAKKCNIDGFTITIDNDCVNRINMIINAENQDFTAAPNNYFKGFLGALIGGVAGAALSIVFYMIGLISAISAFVSIILGAFLYQKFHGKPDKMMIVIVALTTIVLLEATIPVIYIVASGMAAAQEGLSMSAIEAFSLLMEDGEFALYFYRDLAMVFLFSVIGIAFEISYLKRKIKKRKTNI